jgi:hypothetical protein
MNKEQFLSEIYLIFEDRGIKEKPSKAWLKKLYDNIESLSELEFARGLKRINDISQEEWHNKYGFGGKPAISDWVAFFVGKKQSPEKQAIIEVARILDHAKYYLGNDVIFENQFTNATVKKYGGISKIAWDTDKENDNPRPLEWVKKELIDLWLACYDGNHGSFEKCIGRIQPDIFHGGKFIKRENALDFVGDKNRCLALMNKTQEKPLNLSVQQKTSKIVSDIAKGFKSI